LVFYWPAGAVAKKVGVASWEFIINLYLCWQGRQLLGYYPEAAIFENYYKYGLAVLPAMLHAWFFVLKPNPVTFDQVLDTMFPSRNFPGIFVFLWSPLAVWLESGWLSLDFFISCFLWEPLLETPLNSQTQTLMALGWAASVLHAWYVVRRSKPAQIAALEVIGSKPNINYWEILANVLMIASLPNLVVWKRCGIASLDFLMNMGLCTFAYLRWTSLPTVNQDNIRLLAMALLPCILHAWYIVATSSKHLFVYDRFRGWELWEVERKKARVGGKEMELGKIVERWGVGRVMQE
jgi:uncharacterized membrane protein YqaE (UPF0057 family)